MVEGIGSGMREDARNAWQAYQNERNRDWQGDQNDMYRELMRWMQTNQQGWSSGENALNRILQKELQGNMFTQQRDMKLLDAQLRGYMTPGAVAGLNAAGRSTTDQATGPGLVPSTDNRNGLGYGPSRAEARMWTSTSTQANVDKRNNGTQAGTALNNRSIGTQVGATQASTQTNFPKRTRAKATNTDGPPVHVSTLEAGVQASGGNSVSTGTQASTWKFNEATQTPSPVSTSTQTGLNNPGRAIKGGTQSSLGWSSGPLPGLTHNLIDYSGSTQGTNMVARAPIKPASRSLGGGGAGNMSYASAAASGMAGGSAGMAAGLLMGALDEAATDQRRGGVGIGSMLSLRL